ncbi:MAG: PSD1 and planctomycete cytochrome C domain-containing protein [Verrucomicrobiota bacterium]
MSAPLKGIVLSFLLVAGNVEAETHGAVDFARDVQPILSENCFHCHGPDAADRKAGLRLDTQDGAFADLGGYAAVIPGDVDKSELIARITAHGSNDMMPPAKSNRLLTRQQKDLLVRWVEEGAAWADHWAFVAPERPGLPRASDPAWNLNPIDQFIYRRLEREGLQPSPPADYRTLHRRLHLDLTGLPPEETPIDGNPRQLIERLLASRHFGERMALPWLDAARYADSNGFQQDGDRHQWPWRDWVVRAYNENMSFDRFTIEQLAGDLLPEPTQDQLIATGFNRNHMLNGEGGAIKAEQQVNYVVDRVDTTATTWLGLTMACAQCHDHKYDPISQHEFFRFYAYFNNIPETGGVDKRTSGGCNFGNRRSVQFSRPWLEMPTDEQTETRARLKNEIADLEEQVKKEESAIKKAVATWEAGIPPGDKLSAEKFPGGIHRILARTNDSTRKENERKQLREFFLKNVDHGHPEWRTTGEELAARKADLTAVEQGIVTVMVMEENPPDKTRKTHILARGDYQQKGEEVGPGTPSALPEPDPSLPNNRLGLARWLVSRDHPLTARVTVNRLWQQFFGTGLVKTSEDFGVQGERPSHPELLDWLAVEFMDSGWDVKHMVRLVTNSRTYQQSSKFTSQLLATDPENRLLARGTRYRLPAMVLRDQVLSVSGLLLHDIGGPPVYPLQPEGLWEEFSFGKISYPHPEETPQLHRRSLYTFWRRTVAPPNMFDNASRQICTVRESRTNTPLHALTMLNDATYVQAAKAFGQRLKNQSAKTRAAKISDGFAAVTSRPPTSTELDILVRSFARAVTEEGQSPDAAWTQIAQILLNLDETLNRE